MYHVIDEKGNIVARNFIFFGRPRKQLDKGFVKVFYAFLDSIVESDKLAGKSIRLLFYMLSEINYNTLKVTIIPRKAQETLGISKKTYYLWLKDLEEEGIIKKEGKYSFIIQPYYFVKGNTDKSLINTKNDIVKEKHIREKKEIRAKLNKINI